MWWLWASQHVLPLLEAWGWCGQLLGLSKATLPSIQLSFPSQMGLKQIKTSLRLSFGKQQAHVSSSIRIPHPGLEERLGSWAPCLGTAGNWRRNCSHAGSNPTDHSREAEPGFRKPSPAGLCRCHQQSQSQSITLAVSTGPSCLPSTTRDWVVSFCIEEKYSRKGEADVFRQCLQFLELQRAFWLDRL